MAAAQCQRRWLSIPCLKGELVDLADLGSTVKHGEERRTCEDREQLQKVLEAVPPLAFGADPKYAAILEKHALAQHVADQGVDLRQQAFLLTVLVCAVLPLFGALPFILGAPQATFTDAYFEAMSALTTTGGWLSLDGALQTKSEALWRAELQWMAALESGGMAVPRPVR